MDATNQASAERYVTFRMKAPKYGNRIITAAGYVVGRTMRINFTVLSPRDSDEKKEGFIKAKGRAKGKPLMVVDIDDPGNVKELLKKLANCTKTFVKDLPKYVAPVRKELDDQQKQMKQAIKLVESVLGVTIDKSAKRRGLTKLSKETIFRVQKNGLMKVKSEMFKK